MTMMDGTCTYNSYESGQRGQPVRSERRSLVSFVGSSVGLLPFLFFCPCLQERQHVLDAVFRLLNDSRSRFKALMLDLAKICHNEMTKDGLLAYFL